MERPRKRVIQRGMVKKLTRAKKKEGTVQRGPKTIVRQQKGTTALRTNDGKGERGNKRRGGQKMTEALKTSYIGRCNAKEKLSFWNSNAQKLGLDVYHHKWEALFLGRTVRGKGRDPRLKGKKGGKRSDRKIKQQTEKIEIRSLSLKNPRNFGGSVGGNVIRRRGKNEKEKDRIPASIRKGIVLNY